MKNSIQIIVSSFAFFVRSIQADFFRRCCLTIYLACISSFTLAQTQVVTPQLIDQYKLDLSDPEEQTKPYELVIGSNGALYLRDNSNNSYKKISKRMNGVPAKVETGFPGSSGTYYQADKDFDRIVYISKDSNITPGDSGDSEDVFVYSISEDKTIRIEGNNSHEGTVRQVRINPEGGMVAFGSIDWYFGDISNIELNGDINLYHANANLVYLANILNFDSGAGLPYTPEYTANYGQFADFERTNVSICDIECQFLGDSILVAFFFPNTLDASKSITDYDIAKRSFTSVTGEFSGDTSVESYVAEILGDHRHIAIETNYSEFIDYFNVTDSFVYDSWLNEKFSFSEDYPIIMHNGFSFSDSFIKVRGAVSQGNRFVTFQANKLDVIEGDDQISEYNTGRIYVYDIWTNELRPAFSVNRSATSFGYRDTNDYTLKKTTCINCEGIDDYEVEPSNIRFHNDDQYITFEANSWYLDPAVPYSNFSVPYARDVFVVANPFNSDENQATCGEPDTTISADGGTYLWRDCATGQWHLQFLGGNNAQNITGRIIANTGINNILVENLEAADQYTSSLSELEFDLDIQSGDEDGFSYYLTSLTGSCIDISNIDSVNVRVGERQISLSVPFDLKTLKPVSDCGDDDSIIVDGAPVIDYATDQGWYIWRENGIWQSRFSAGGTKIQYIGSIESTQAMSNLQPISIETSDDLQINPSTSVNFNLFVKGPYRDGFSVAIPNSANTCVNLSSPSGANIYLGPNAVVMPNSFDLNTYTGCGTTPVIETLGKPSIDRSSDKGIFLWENSDNNWQVEVVSGDIKRTLKIDVLSQQVLSNVEKVNIESSDVFTIMPMSLDLSLRVKSPWYDGFKFGEQAQSGTCVSTTSNAVPIFLGPDRVDVGDSINLSTQSSCP